MAVKYSKGWYRALQQAHGDETEVYEDNGGWCGSLTSCSYDDNGEPIPFT